MHTITATRKELKFWEGRIVYWCKELDEATPSNRDTCSKALDNALEAHEVNSRILRDKLIQATRA